MLAALRSRALSLPSSSPSPSSLPQLIRQLKLGFVGFDRCYHSPLVGSDTGAIGLLNLEEVEKVLTDVKADNVKVVPVDGKSEWADFMVFVTGRSAWHVRNIAQALIYKVKEKQRGAERMLLPSVEGEKEGKWIVVDSGTIIIHALDEKARAYYNMERLWTNKTSAEDQPEDLQKAFVKVRRKNNSKKPAQRSLPA